MFNKAIIIFCCVLLALSLLKSANATQHELNCCKNDMLINRTVCHSGDMKVWEPVSLRCPGKNATVTPHYNGTHLYLKTVNGEDALFLGQYCLGKKLKGNRTRDAAIICIDDDIITGIDLQLSSALMFASVPFLLLTVLVYSVLPELSYNDVQGKSIISLCTSFAIGLFLLAFQKIWEHQYFLACGVLAFVILYFILAAFFWMNAITIQVYRSIARPSLAEGSEFQYYNAYAWGGATFIILMNIAHNTASKLQVGTNTCWFNDEAEWYFIRGPIGIIVVINCILFAITAARICLGMGYKPAGLRSTLLFRFKMFAKMAIIMGIGWLTEVGSALHGSYHIIWHIMDAFNCLQGVFIFIVLVLTRKRALRGLARRKYLGCLSDSILGWLERNKDEEQLSIITQTDNKVELVII